MVELSAKSPHRVHRQCQGSWGCARTSQIRAGHGGRKANAEIRGLGTQCLYQVLWFGGTAGRNPHVFQLHFATTRLLGALKKTDLEKRKLKRCIDHGIACSTLLLKYKTKTTLDTGCAGINIAAPEHGTCLCWGQVDSGPGGDPGGWHWQGAARHMDAHVCFLM